MRSNKLRPRGGNVLVALLAATISAGVSFSNAANAAETPAKASAPASAAPAVSTSVIRGHRPNGVVIASAHRLATEAGQEVIAKGGNAFDAAVAVSAVLSVVEPYSSGLGGGAFFLLHDAKSGRDVMVDARETAPASAVPAKYLDAKGDLDRDRAENGPWSSGVPGLPAALAHVASTYGRVPLTVSLAPAIRIAEQGFPVNSHVANNYADRREVMERYAGTRKVYLADGDAPKVGETLRQPDLADTLRRIATQGRDGFYRGQVAKRIVADINKYGGEWTLADMEGYAVRERTPIRFRYRDWDIVTAPPPSSGGVALAEMLQVIEGWDLKALDEPHRVHVLTEAMRRAYRDRTLWLGDPDFVQVPVSRLTSDDYAAGLRAGIMADKATPSAMLPGGKSPRESDHTTHFSIIDAEGNLVAVTQTVNLTYGSGLVAEGTGVLMNDEMDDFALKPGTPNAFGVMGYDANAVAPGRRMLSSMTPSFMLGADRVAVLGTPGGSKIITMVLLGMLGVEQGLSPAEVVALPRFHHQYLPDTIYLEPGALSPATVSLLEGMGHAFTQNKGTWGNMNAADWNLVDGSVRGGSDPRSDVGAAIVVPSASQPEREKATP
jgi:gamma-glutamyltranspeptidase/glutathione hydrolase